MLLYLILILLQPTHSLIDVITQTANAKYLMRFKQFELGASGTASVSVNYNKNLLMPLRIYICNAEEISVLLDTYSSIEQICADFNSTGGCRAVLDVNDGGYLRTVNDVPLRSSWTATIVKDVYLQFYYLNCNSHQAKFTTNYKLINPNGEQVGLGQVPLRSMYLLFAVVWSFVFLAMLFTLYYWCRKKKSLVHGLHKVLVMIGLIGVCSSFYSYDYWYSYSKDAKPNGDKKALMDLTSGIFVISVLLVSILVSKGWQTVDAFRGSVAGSDWRTIGMLFCVYGFTYAFYSVYGGSFFPLFMLIMCFFILVRYVHRGIKLNLFVLRHQLTIMGAVLGMNPRGSPVLLQFEAMLLCLKVLPGLMASHLCVRLWDMTRSIHEQPEWLGSLAHNIWCLLVVVFLFVTFRVKGVERWSPRTLIDEQTAAAAAAAANESGADENEGDLENGLPLSKPEAFQKAFFVASGWERNVDDVNVAGAGNNGSGGVGSGSVGSGGVGSSLMHALHLDSSSHTHRTIKMTTSLRKNPNCLTVATEPWKVSPGTIVMKRSRKIVPVITNGENKKNEQDEKKGERIERVGDEREVVAEEEEGKNENGNTTSITSMQGERKTTETLEIDMLL